MTSKLDELTRIICENVHAKMAQLVAEVNETRVLTTMEGGDLSPYITRLTVTTIGEKPRVFTVLLVDEAEQITDEEFQRAMEIVEDWSSKEWLRAMSPGWVKDLLEAAEEE